jgi:serine/threonine-protein kinase
LAKLHGHENIVRYHYSDVDVDDNRPYIVTEFVDGGTLKEWCHGRPVAACLEVLAQAAHGLDFAHRMGVRHRDVTPANLMVTSDGWVKIVDFGIAKSGDSAITPQCIVVGTPAYIAPEIFCGEESSPAPDQYSLAVVAYEVLGG